jgi:hypothetical protein
MALTSVFKPLKLSSLKLSLRLLLVQSLVVSHTWAQQIQPDKQPDTLTRQPIKVTLTQARFLPPAMYGQWSISAVLVKSNAPGYFAPVVNDIWVLERVDDQVTVTNPANGASATVNVDEVSGNTAVFHRRVDYPDRHQVFWETPKVTVEGDRLFGITDHRLDTIKDGEVTRHLFAQYELTAQRIGGERVKFGPGVPSSELQFDVEDIQTAPQPRPSSSKSEPSLYAR